MNHKTIFLLTLLVASLLLISLPPCFASSLDENPVTVTFEVNNTGTAGIQVFESRITAPYGNTAYANSSRVYYANGTPVEAFWHPYTTNNLKLVLLIRANLSAGVNNFILTTGSPNLTSVQDIGNVTTSQTESDISSAGSTIEVGVSETSNWIISTYNQGTPTNSSISYVNIVTLPADPVGSAFSMEFISATNNSSVEGTVSSYNITIGGNKSNNAIGVSFNQSVAQYGPQINAVALGSPEGSETFGIRLGTFRPYSQTLSPIAIGYSDEWPEYFNAFQYDSPLRLNTSISIFTSNVSISTTTLETSVYSDPATDLKSWVFVNMLDNNQKVSTTKPFIDTFSGNISSAYFNSASTVPLLVNYGSYSTTTTANDSSFYFKRNDANLSIYSTDSELSTFSTPTNILTHRSLSTYSSSTDLYYNYSAYAHRDNSPSRVTEGYYNLNQIDTDIFLYRIPLTPMASSNDVFQTNFIWSNTRTSVFLYNTTTNNPYPINPFFLDGGDVLSPRRWSSAEPYSVFFDNSDVSYTALIVESTVSKAFYYLKQGEHTVNLTIRDQNTKEIIKEVTGFLDDAQIIRSTDTGVLKYTNVTDGWHVIILQAGNYTQVSREFYIDENQTNVTLYMSGGNQSGSGGDVLVSPNYVTFRVVNQLGNGLKNYTAVIEDINDPSNPVTFIDLNVQNSDTFYASLERTTNYKVTVTSNNGSWTKEHYVYGAEDYAYYVIMVQDQTIESQGDIFTNYTRSWAVNATNYTLTIAPINDTVEKAYLIGTGESTLYNLDANTSITVTPVVSYSGDILIIKYPNGFLNSSLRWDIQLNTLEDAPRGFRFSGTETWTSARDTGNKLNLGLSSGVYSTLAVLIAVVLMIIFASARITWLSPAVGILSLMLFYWLGWYVPDLFTSILLAIGSFVVIFEIMKKDKTNFG